MPGDEKPTHAAPVAIVVTGPTAVGKTSVAIGLARALDAEIISMDSRLVFRGLDIGTDKPALEERVGTPHHLIDVADPGDRFTAADFTERCRALIGEISARGRTPILAGGTLLYLAALTKGFDFRGVDRSEEIRTRLEAEADERGTAAMRRELALANPAAAAKIHPNDRYRILRALEVSRVAGTPLAGENPPPPPLRLLTVALHRPREILYAAINKRAEWMYNNGLIEETEKVLREHPCSRELLENVIGYAQALGVLEGRISKLEAMEETRKRTRHFARRQMIWLRRVENATWVSLSGETADTVRDLASFIKGGQGAPA